MAPRYIWKRVRTTLHFHLVRFGTRPRSGRLFQGSAGFFLWTVHALWFLRGAVANAAPAYQPGSPKMSVQQTEFGFVESCEAAKPAASFPFQASEALSLYARRKGQKWLRVEAARSLRKNARSQSRAGHDRQSEN
jgi:hypothetical protein